MDGREWRKKGAGKGDEVDLMLQDILESGDLSLKLWVTSDDYHMNWTDIRLPPLRNQGDLILLLHHMNFLKDRVLHKCTQQTLVETLLAAAILDIIPHLRWVQGLLQSIGPSTPQDLTRSGNRSYPKSIAE